MSPLIAPVLTSVFSSFLLRPLTGLTLTWILPNKASSSTLHNLPNYIFPKKIQPLRTIHLFFTICNINCCQRSRWSRSEKRPRRPATSLGKHWEASGRGWETSGRRILTQAKLTSRRRSRVLCGRWSREREGHGGMPTHGRRRPSPRRRDFLTKFCPSTSNDRPSKIPHRHVLYSSWLSDLISKSAETLHCAIWMLKQCCWSAFWHNRHLSAPSNIGEISIVQVPTPRRIKKDTALLGTASTFVCRAFLPTSAWD